MTASHLCSHSWRPAARLAALGIVFATWLGMAQAQTDPPDSYFQDSTSAASSDANAAFQYSSLTGSGNTITATWVPVLTSKGTIYKNITLLFQLDSAGNLTIAPGYPKVAGAPAITVSAFKAGKYVAPTNVLNGQAIINVSGPGVGTGGATQWSLAAATGANGCTYPGSAIWFVGPMAGTPLAPRLKAAGITSTAWSYGVIGGTVCWAEWSTNALIGFSQIGNTLNVVSFTRNGVDKNEPVDQVTYTLAQ
jgi:hypothetical protein